MGSVSFGSVGGSGSGIDVLGFVNQVLFAERAPVRLLETQQVLLDAQSSALSDINTKLSDLKDAINALKDLSGKFNTKITASSDTSVLTATADASATAATHSITVSALATTSSYYSSQLADGSTTFATGSFDLQIGTGSPTTITVDATNDTLDDLATHINSLALGVTASVITDADGARLSILSDASGVPGDLTISNNTTGLTFTKAATGTNASLTVNNVPINSTSNTVSGSGVGVGGTSVGGAVGSGMSIGGTSAGSGSSSDSRSSRSSADGCGTMAQLPSTNMPTTRIAGKSVTTQARTI